jgi:hypothetical protein
MEYSGFVVDSSHRENPSKCNTCKTIHQLERFSRRLFRSDLVPTYFAHEEEVAKQCFMNLGITDHVCELSWYHRFWLS